MMSKIAVTVAEGLELSPYEVFKRIGIGSVPGETLRLNDSRTFAGETDAVRAARRDLFGDGELTVAESRIDQAESGWHVATYVFAGVEGRHSVKLFSESAGVEQVYGLLIGREGQAWFVGMEGVGASAKVEGAPRRIGAVLPRSARFCFGVKDEFLDGQAALIGYERGVAFADDAAFFDRLQGEPATGEFAIRPSGDGQTWVLEFAPWSSGFSAHEVDLAEAAIGEQLSREAAPEPRA